MQFTDTVDWNDFPEVSRECHVVLKKISSVDLTPPVLTQVQLDPSDCRASSFSTAGVQSMLGISAVYTGTVCNCHV